MIKNICFDASGIVVICLDFFRLNNQICTHEQKSQSVWFVNPYKALNV